MKDQANGKRRRQRGNANVEFALCAIFIIFLMISMVDMARGLWIYHTLAEAVRDGTRASIVRGSRYANPNTQVRMTDTKLANTLSVIRQFAVGLDPAVMDVVFETVNPNTGVATTYATCKANGSGCTATQPWPPDTWFTPGQVIGITARYPYNSMVVMYFPGMKGVEFGKYVLGSTSRATIVF